MKNDYRLKLVLLGFFAVAFGLFESITVFYLRKIPETANSIAFPLIPNFPKDLLFVEQTREIATIILLIALAWIAAESYWEKLAIFLYSFALWDISYYFYLYILIDFPSSISQLDVVYLFPFPWWFPYWLAISVMVLFLIAAFWIIRNKVNDAEKIKIR